MSKQERTSDRVHDGISKSADPLTFCAIARRFGGGETHISLRASINSPDCFEEYEKAQNPPRCFGGRVMWPYRDPGRVFEQIANPQQYSKGFCGILGRLGRPLHDCPQTAKEMHRSEPRSLARTRSYSSDRRNRDRFPNLRLVGFQMSILLRMDF